MSKSPTPKTNPNSLYRTDLHWWRGLSWAMAHVYPLCPQAFMENPVGFGGLLGIVRPERMRTGTARNVLSSHGKALCVTCARRFMADRSNELIEEL